MKARAGFDRLTNQRKIRTRAREGGKKIGPQVVRHPRPCLVAKGELLNRNSVSLAAAGG